MLTARSPLDSRLGTARLGRLSGCSPGGVLASLLTSAILSGACAKQLETGPPLSDPGALATRLRAQTGPERPFNLRFEWQYADEDGRLSGEGVARYNPRDSIRLDMFTTGDASMAVAVTPAGLATLGEIENVRLPRATFLYAMAGIFRPEMDRPTGGFESEGSDVLVYDADDTSLHVFVVGLQIRRIEERDRGRVLRRIEIEWGDADEWPTSAEFRDFVESRRVRWTLGEANQRQMSHEAHIYDLPNSF